MLCLGLLLGRAQIGPLIPPFRKLTTPLRGTGSQKSPVIHPYTVIPMLPWNHIVPKAWFAQWEARQNVSFTDSFYKMTCQFFFIRGLCPPHGTNKLLGQAEEVLSHFINSVR